MKKIHRIISASAALLMAVPTCYAMAADSEEVKYTFDEKHRLDDKVSYSLFNMQNVSSEIKENVEKKILSAAGRDSISDLTYGDLQKITTLDLSKMNLRSLPSVINYMEKIRTLNLSHNLLRYDDVSNINLEGCTELRNLNLSYNYFTKVPIWYINDDITTRNIDYNLLNNENQRSIKVSTESYYYMVGDTVNRNALKNKILASVRLNDNSLLPDFLYDSTDPPYNESDDSDAEPEKDYPLHIEDWGLEDKLDSDGKVTLSGSYETADITVRLYNDLSNVNTTATVKIYIVDGSDPSTVKVRLEGLLSDCEKLDKSGFTQSSWTNFETVEKTSRAIFEYSGADTEMLRTALQQLIYAKNGLVEGIDADTKKVLSSLASIGGAYKADDYTPQSWKTFSSALDDVKKASSDADATLYQAKSAIKYFQQAQADLTPSVLSVPSKAPKTDFEQIFGENKNVTYKGVTKYGRKYQWTFNGKNLTEPKEFNPEVNDSPADENGMIAEAGSVGNYFGFTVVQTDKLPGKGTLSISVSDKFTDGNYYLYKWDSTAKSGRMIDTVKVSGKTALAEISEGGTYYISPVAQKFDLQADQYVIDAEKKTLTIPVDSSNKVKNVRSGFRFGNLLEIKSQNGAVVSDTSSLKTGMTVGAPKDSAYSVILMGDVNDDGNRNSKDAVEILKTIVAGRTTDSLKLCGDVNGDGGVNAKDAVEILKAIVK